MNARIQGSAEAGPDWDPRALLQHAGGSQTASAAEVELLHRFDSAVATMELLSREDQTHVRAVLETIVQGQAMDLKRFSGATADRLTALRRLEETEDYTFRVAGCVGEFWTRECASHLVSAHEWDERSQVEDGIRFGKGLQWVNILRDLPRDLRMGRCYLPSEELAEVGLVPKHLLAITAWTQLKPLYLKWTDHAEEHLNAGWRYLMRTPAHQRRLRFASAVPLVLGYRTLSLLRNGNPLDPQSRIKASRAEVRSALWQIALACLGLRGWSQIQSWARESRSR
ncbi:MAG: hypothetical protein FJ405_17400 [Verrucomicrobia bacterium]|nr:hypothetical protein [Verrucomicrobiota bacterium]